MGIWQKFKNLGRKQSRTYPVQTAILPLGRAVKPKANYESFAKEGYMANSIAHACIREISGAAAGVPLALFRQRGSKVEEVESHGILELLDHPNPMQGRFAFIEALIAFLYLSGNTFIEAVGPETGRPRELYNLRPDRMGIIPDRFNLVGGYVYQVGQEKATFNIDEVMHQRLWHPIEDFVGLSPIQVAALAIDKMNQGNMWNAALLQNMAVPSGQLVSKKPLNDDQFNRLKSEMRETFSGVANARNPVLLEDEMEWKEMGVNPKDMDFIKGLNLSAMEITQVYNMPPELVGLQPATYQNRKEARKALYTEVVCPALQRLVDGLNTWLIPKFGDTSLFLAVDKDGIEALSEDRDSLWKRAEAKFLTVNEKRELVGYDKVQDGDVILVQAGLTTLEDATTPLDFGDPDGTRASNLDLEVKAINPRNPAARRREARTMKRLRQKFERVMEKRVAGLFGKDGEIVADLFEQFGMGRALEEIDARRAVWEDALSQVNQKSILFFAERTVKQVKGMFGPDEMKAEPEQVLTLFEQLSGKFARELSAAAIKDISDTTRAKIRAVIEEGVSEGLQNHEIAETIREKFDVFTEGRAKNISRTEIHNSQNFASLESVKQLKVIDLKKVWLWSGVSREEHASVDGISVELSSDFAVGSVPMARPGDPRGGAENVINCACALAFERG